MKELRDVEAVEERGEKKRQGYQKLEARREEMNESDGLELPLFP